MKLIIIFGPPAVGKMTVGLELANFTGLKLFHNHMSIELVLPFFDFGEPQFNQLVSEFRRRIFEVVASSNLPGLIFTFVWALDVDADKKFIDETCEIFRAKGADIYFVELEADLAERLKRNESELRLTQKPSKRDVGKSREILLKHVEEYRFNTDGDFFYPQNYLKLENTSLSAREAATRIIQAFGLPRIDAAVSG
jgi:shikimate kinase